MIFQRDHRLCRLRLPGCTVAATHIDHIVPVSQGGAWFDPNNLRASCRWCNLSRPLPQRQLNTREW